MRKTVLNHSLTTEADDTFSPNPCNLGNRLTSLFARHGSPRPHAASHLAASIRRIQTISTFANFLAEMDIGRRNANGGLEGVPGKVAFTSFLRDTVKASVEKGYSKWALEQEEALSLRLVRDPGV